MKKVHVKLRVRKKTSNHPFYKKVGSANCYQYKFLGDSGKDDGSEEGYHEGDIELTSGTTCRFYLSEPDHPLYITTSESGGAGMPGKVSSVHGNQGVTSGYLDVKISESGWYYQCGRHLYMGGRIIVLYPSRTVASGLYVLNSTQERSMDVEIRCRDVRDPVFLIPGTLGKKELIVADRDGRIVKVDTGGGTSSILAERRPEETLLGLFLSETGFYAMRFASKKLLVTDERGQVRLTKDLPVQSKEGLVIGFGPNGSVHYILGEGEKLCTVTEAGQIRSFEGRFSHAKCIAWDKGECFLANSFLGKEELWHISEKGHTLVHSYGTDVGTGIVDGRFYRGTKHQDLIGSYVIADASGKIFALKEGKETPTWKRYLIHVFGDGIMVQGLGCDHDQELYVLCRDERGGVIYTLGHVISQARIAIASVRFADTLYRDFPDQFTIAKEETLTFGFGGRSSGKVSEEMKDLRREIEGLRRDLMTSQPTRSGGGGGMMLDPELLKRLMQPPPVQQIKREERSVQPLESGVKIEKREMSTGDLDIKQQIAEGIKKRVAAKQRGEIARSLYYPTFESYLDGEYAFAFNAHEANPETMPSPPDKYVAGGRVNKYWVEKWDEYRLPLEMEVKNINSVLSAELTKALNSYLEWWRALPEAKKGLFTKFDKYWMSVYVTPHEKTNPFFRAAYRDWRELHAKDFAPAVKTEETIATEQGAEAANIIAGIETRLEEVEKIFPQRWALKESANEAGELKFSDLWRDEFVKPMTGRNSSFKDKYNNWLQRGGDQKLKEVGKRALAAAKQLTKEEINTIRAEDAQKKRDRAAGKKSGKEEEIPPKVIKEEETNIKQEQTQPVPPPPGPPPSPP